MRRLLRAKRSLMRALRAQPEESPQAPRKLLDWPATMDPLFRHLRRHCRSTDVLTDDTQQLPLKTMRRISAKVIEPGTTPDAPQGDA